ncbi:MAG: hypothetical protein HY788_04090 [Deltaproteobacteria bacterium]|nr:hypothetical protein [Deltaproteobacteria bacterium]
MTVPQTETLETPNVLTIQDTMVAERRSFTHFIHWFASERPIDWRKRFGRTARLELEIGFGRGDYLRERAQANPDTDVVGVDLKWKPLLKALSDLEHHKVDNARLLQVDAAVALERLIRPLSIDNVVALFPTPWPREQQSKQRLFSNDFLKLLNSRLTPGAQVQIVTDHERFAKWILDQAADTGFAVFRRTIGPTFGTKFERKWLRKGQREFHELLLRKEIHLSVPLKEDSNLLHYHTDRFAPIGFQPMGERCEHYLIEFKDYLYDPGQRKGLVRAFVAEGSLLQTVWIEIVEEQGGWRIRLPKGYGVVPTEGVFRALELVRDQAGR